VVFAQKKKEKEEKEKEKRQKAREKQVHRAALLLKRLNEKPPTDLAERAAICLAVQKIPDDIRAEATNLAPVGEASGGGGESPIAEEVAEQLEKTIQEVLAESDTMSELAEELDISEEELAELMKDPEFKSMVAEELADG
jgi:hypothetical protein